MINNAEQILLASIETLIYENKLEMQLINAYCAQTFDKNEMRDIIETSMSRISSKLDNINSIVAKIQTEELV